MIRLSITPAAFDAIASTLPLGSVGFERQGDDKGEVAVWLDPRVVDKLKALRGPGESLQRRDPAAGRDRGAK